jgi:hypothetical protein
MQDIHQQKAKYLPITREEYGYVQKTVSKKNMIYTSILIYLARRMNISQEKEVNKKLF